MIPCPFRAVTGWKCPGCGITHMVLCLARLDFAGAYAENPFLTVTLPVLACITAGDLLRRIKGKKAGKLQMTVQYAYLTALLLFGVWRNL